jgi:hypothetical protein
MSRAAAAVAAWDAQTQRVRAAGPNELELANVERAIAGIPAARRLAARQDLDAEEEVAEVLAAIDRFEAALLERLAS